MAKMVKPADQKKEIPVHKPEPPLSLVERKERGKAVYKKAKETGEFNRLENYTKEQQAKFLAEIAGLESRIVNETVDVDLGNGVTIAVRQCLTDAELQRLEYLEMQQLTEQNNEKRAEMMCEGIEIITANPLITKTWLMENKNMYSPTDILHILLGYREVRLEERLKHVQHLRDVVAFRSKSGRAELRELPALHEDKRPT